MKEQYVPRIEDALSVLAHVSMHEEGFLYNPHVFKDSKLLAAELGRASWRHESLGLLLDGSTGYVASHLNADDVDGLRIPSEKEEAHYINIKSGDTLVKVDNVIPRHRFTRVRTGLVSGTTAGAGAGGVGGYLAEVIPHVPSVAALGVAIPAGLIVGHFRRAAERRELAAAYARQYKALYESIGNGTPLNARAVYFYDVSADSAAKKWQPIDTKPYLTGIDQVHKPANTNGYRRWDFVLSECGVNVFGVVNHLLASAGKNAPELWAGGLQESAIEASRCTDVFSAVKEQYDQEQRVHRLTGLEDPQEENLKEQLLMANEQLINSVDTLIGHRETVVLWDRRQRLSEKISNLALHHNQKDGTAYLLRPELDTLYGQLFSALLDLEIDNPETEAIIHAVIADFRAVEATFTDVSQLSRFQAFFSNKYAGPLQLKFN